MNLGCGAPADKSDMRSHMTPSRRGFMRMSSVFVMSMFGVCDTSVALAQSVGDFGLIEINCSDRDALSDKGNCSIMNKASGAIAMVSFRLTLREDGRAVPWGMNEVKFWIDGGLEPGETVTEEVKWPPLPDRAQGRDVQYLVEDVMATDPVGYSMSLPIVEDTPPPEPRSLSDTLRIAIQRCWNIGALSASALKVSVDVAFDVGREGRPDNSSIALLGSTGGDEAAVRQAYEAAKRAIVRCGAGGLGLPEESYEEWRTVNMRFQSSGRGTVILDHPAAN